MKLTNKQICEAITNSTLKHIEKTGSLNEAKLNEIAPIVMAAAKPLVKKGLQMLAKKGMQKLAGSAAKSTAGSFGKKLSNGLMDTVNNLGGTDKIINTIMPDSNGSGINGMVGKFASQAADTLFNSDSGSDSNVDDQTVKTECRIAESDLRKMIQECVSSIVNQLYETNYII